MLILTRREGQKILMGRGLIQITVIKADRGNIKIGFHAPSNIDIEREEIYFKKLAQRALKESAL
jgi:carbon storage regulator